MKSRLLIAGFVTALATSFAALAADAPAADTAAKPAAPAKKVKPHYHPEANKQAPPAPEKPATAEEVKKPLHEHMKEHKQQ